MDEHLSMFSKKCMFSGKYKAGIYSLLDWFMSKYRVKKRVAEPPDFRRLRLWLRPFKNKTAPAPGEF